MQTSVVVLRSFRIFFHLFYSHRQVESIVTLVEVSITLLVFNRRVVYGVVHYAASMLARMYVVIVEGQLFAIVLKARVSCKYV